MVGADQIITIVSILLSGGLVGVLLRFRPEKQNLLAQASEMAVQSLVKSMEDLEDRLTDAQRREVELLEEMGELRVEMEKLRNDLHKHKSDLVRISLERDAWKQRAKDLGWSEQ